MFKIKIFKILMCNNLKNLANYIKRCKLSLAFQLTFNNISQISNTQNKILNKKIS